MKSNLEYCPHCLPQKVKSHFPQKVEYYSDKISKVINKVKNILPLESRITTVLGMKFLEMIGIVRYVPEVDKTRIRNRHTIFFDEAKKQGLEIYNVTFFRVPTDEFMIVLQGKQYFFEGNPLHCLPYKTFIDIDDKLEVKKFLDSHNIPVAKGDIFLNIEKALHFGIGLGFPLVVKPRSGSLSVHVTTDIQSVSELKEAILIAKKFRQDFLVERHVSGKLYRATVVGKKHIFICEKESPNIIGDGETSVQELVSIKNASSGRGKQHDNNSTLHEISMDLDFLAQQGFTADYIPLKDQKIYVNKKTTLSVGSDIINCLNNTHKDTIDLFLHISEITNCELVGIDFICKDISVSYKEQDTAVLELNSLPYIDMHQRVSHGENTPVAEIVWDFVIEKLK
jgi:D-alanine-D-alanine ligase-like ATP-grasp enzyme